ncbi:MAG: mechanosensitive ion channel [Sandaracinus sp.]|nr:mechanosensitive ion channel [Sandaracinus sp.]
MTSDRRPRPRLPNRRPTTRRTSSCRRVRRTRPSSHPTSPCPSTIRHRRTGRARPCESPRKRSRSRSRSALARGAYAQTTTGASSGSRETTDATTIETAPSTEADVRVETHDRRERNETSPDDSRAETPTPLARLRAALDALGEEDVVAEEAGGILRLRGHAPSPDARSTAESVANAIGGWLHVDNRIEVDATDDEGDDQAATDVALEGTLRDLFARVDELSGVEVRARSGVVELSGVVPTEAARDRALAYAEERDGVIYVEADDLRADRTLSRRLEATLDELRARAEEAVASLPLLLLALGVVALAFFVAGRIRAAKKLGLRITKHPMTAALLRQALAAAVIAGGVFFALDLLDATTLVGALLGTAGVVGLALGFAFKDLVENHLASLFLAVRRPFESGDLVAIGDREGVVVRLTGRDTVLMTPDGNHVRVPNAEVYKAVVTNFSRNPRRRFDFVVAVGVDEDLALVQQRALDALAEQEGVLADPTPFVRVSGLGDFAVDVQIFGWVDQRAHDFGKVKSEAIRRVKRAFDDAQIEMPFPTRVVKTSETAVLADLDADDAPQTKRDDSGPRRRPTHEPDVDLRPDRSLEAEVHADRARGDEEDLLAS